ncbi:DUF1707 and DUF2154 domain-containing protein [Nocardioides sp. Y6]|uniref:DUF1707 and DUF2154 domain-containing protein n=1 Tax=Nocardioides malaquae TaxID=2773426 RepID=A0ABR9RQQ6_9ACTN|nr:DUF1707 domain-containing protein [Nocardioides malaquae]MBE7323905.1 DUF1707 and DUF2154 domain-containing protein [Nocardioides malaquae]
MEQFDPSQMRVSDDDRHRVAEVLREAAAQGRIDLEELDERLETAYGAKVYADLVPLTVDLPGPHLPAEHEQVLPQPVGPGGPPVASYATSTAVLSSVGRKGMWRLPERHAAVAVMGEVTLDLREAVFTSREVVITANAVMGSVDVFVNAGTHVIVEGSGILGTFEQGRDRVLPAQDAGAPIVRVRGVALMGAVTVTRKRMPGEPRGRGIRKFLQD